jgi:hypothetical protein
VALLSTDRVDWALDAAGDLIMPIRYTTGNEAVAQGIRRRLLAVRGEIFTDRDAGVPYHEGNGVDPSLVILGRRFDPVRSESAFREAILKTPGVDQILSFGQEFDTRTRKLSVEARVRTVFGDTVDVTAERAV